MVDIVAKWQTQSTSTYMDIFGNGSAKIFSFSGEHSFTTKQKLICHSWCWLLTREEEKKKKRKKSELKLENNVCPQKLAGHKNLKHP